MKRTLLSLTTLGLVTVSATGCQTFFHSTAPAKQGYIYVVGAHNSKPIVWLCPDAPKKGECHEVTVTEDDGD